MGGPVRDKQQNVLVVFSHVSAMTEKAYRIALNDKGIHEGMWIPKSQIAHIDKSKGEMYIPEWLAEKCGLTFS